MFTQCYFTVSFSDVMINILLIAMLVLSLSAYAVPVPVPVPVRAPVAVAVAEAVVHDITRTEKSDIINATKNESDIYIRIEDAPNAKPSLLRCFQSPHIGKPFFISDRTECHEMAEAHYTLAIQSERDPAQSCLGEPSQSQKISTQRTEGPVHLGLSGGKNAWKYHLKQNYRSNRHPCGKGYFNWYVVMAHTGHADLQLPAPARLGQKLLYTYRDDLRGDGGRFLAGIQVKWDNKIFLVEVNLISRWGDAHPEVDIVLARAWPGDYGAQLEKYVLLNAKQMQITGIPVKNRQQIAMINWKIILQNLIDRGFLPRPVHGLENAQTQAIFAGVEHKNEKANGAGVSELELGELSAIDLDTKLHVFPPHPESPGQKKIVLNMANNKDDTSACPSKIKGYFRVGNTIFHAQKAGYCSFDTWENYLKSNLGSGDFSGYPVLGKEPHTCLQYAGTCWPEQIRQPTTSPTRSNSQRQDQIQNQQAQ